eukprot:3463411-Rhodomonas_salina.1
MKEGTSLSLAKTGENLSCVWSAEIGCVLVAARCLMCSAKRYECVMSDALSIPAWGAMAALRHHCMLVAPYNTSVPGIS